jgi:hypothetical protein
MSVRYGRGGWCLRVCVMVASTMLGLSALAGVARANFGFVPGSLSMQAVNADGTVDTQAGSHPFAFTVHFALKTDEKGESEGGEMRNAIVDLPPGLYADPSLQAVPRCTQQDFDSEGQCPLDTQVGVLSILLPGFGAIRGPLFNIEPPPGVPAEFGFNSVGFISNQFASLLSQEGYGVAVSALNAPLETTSVSETVWGVPADSRHDSERESARNSPPNASTAPVRPYLTLPTSCGAPPQVTASVDSNEDPKTYVSETAPLTDSTGTAVPLTGCAGVPFVPKIAAQATTLLASNPSGLQWELKLPDDGLLNPDGVAETQPRSAKIVLPEGMTVNPSVAVGLDVCSEAQYASEQLNSVAGTGCPEGSRIGQVTAYSPLIEEPVEGSLYLATPYANPFKTLLALYLVARAKERGVLVKQAGEIELNQATGQITTTFDGLPPLPYSSFQVRLREGATAPLATPSTCGSYESKAVFTPFSAESDDETTTVSSNLLVEHGADGGACPSGGLPPFKPGLSAGMLNNAAGHYSPLLLRIERHDGEQEITGFSTLLPPGLTGNLTGVPFCSDVAIQRAREQSGSEAEATPACPAASQIGHSIAEAGVGSVLAQAPGNLYLAGPFEGAPFSIVSITAAKVGPFDLGTVVVHLPLNINPITAQVSIPSGPADQIPHIIEGVVIHLRSISVWVDRADFTLNPTSCQPMGITDTVDGAGLNVASPTDDTQAASSDRFQLADCANLAFKPSFSATTSGKTSRHNGASLHVKLTYPKTAQGTQANIRAVKVDLPKQLPSRLTTLQKACTAATFQANPASCPAASRVGAAKAVTPVIPVPLEGPAYFVSYGGAKFPELVVVLQGYGVTIDLHGETFIDKAGITSSTFRAVPDQPVASFELTLPQGKYSALAANGNLCTAKLEMPTAFTAQNGATFKQSTPISVTGCAKHKTKNTKKKHKKANAHKRKN